ncbi:hypothetical protein [Ancylobacter amanitiformis]|uniref:His-Xaa-Ser system protein HxsD n=1 Tax=Ancylobacter amanitiformis TaxID=217069 RepID=A0ABU0LY45_9HYPH|nr:hypothetical protein [Ancylobacter amanitiformis]MDQ0513523.1 hypothetical protein [Ancylobacter amanitiformis]
MDTLLANTSLTEEKGLVKGDLFQWANESFQIAISDGVLYCFKKNGSCWYTEQDEIWRPTVPSRKIQLSQAYLASFEQVAAMRVQRAGFRLVHLINKALDPSYTEPVQNAAQKP